MSDLINQLQFITYEMALLGLFITAGVILIAQDWRVLVLALLIQYILEGMILSRLVRPDIAILKVLIGAFICPILFLSARQVSVSSLSVVILPQNQPRARNRLSLWWREISGVLFSGTGDRGRSLPSTGVVFRLFVALLMILVTLTLSNTFPLPSLPPSVTTAIYWLALAGLVILMLTEDPLKAGVGLFTALTGFSLIYSTLESSLLLIGLWGAVNLLIALAIGYLIVVKGTGPEEEI